MIFPLTGFILTRFISTGTKLRTRNSRAFWRRKADPGRGIGRTGKFPKGKRNILSITSIGIRPKHIAAGQANAFRQKPNGRKRLAADWIAIATRGEIL